MSKLTEMFIPIEINKAFAFINCNDTLKLSTLVYIVLAPEKVFYVVL